MPAGCQSEPRRSERSTVPAELRVRVRPEPRVRKGLRLRPAQRLPVHRQRVQALRRPLTVPADQTVQPAEPLPRTTARHSAAIRTETVSRRVLGPKDSRSAKSRWSQKLRSSRGESCCPDVATQKGWSWVKRWEERRVG